MSRFAIKTVNTTTSIYQLVTTHTADPVLISSQQSLLIIPITNFRAENILITGTAPRVSLAGISSRLTVRLSIVPHQSRPTKKTPSTPEKKGTMISSCGITPFRNVSPTSLSSSQVYRVILNLATTTTPPRTTVKNSTSTTAASIKGTTPAGSLHSN